MIDMKKRIIASILVVVMLVLALASCSGGFSFVDEDLSAYATFDEAAFREALQKIEIEDGDFTTNEETRKKKLAEKIYSSLASAVITNAKSYEADKLETGVVGDRDVVYYCYYATDANGNVFMYSNMKESTLTSTGHSLKLGAVDEDDELAVKIATAIKGFDMENYYSMKTSSDLDDTSVKAGDTIVVSYTREYTVSEEGEDGEPVITAYVSKAVYEVITLTAGDAISDILLNPDNTVKVGSSVKVKDGNSTKDKFTITENIDGTDRECTYSSFKIEWLIDKAGTPITVTHTPYTSTNEVQPDSLYTSSKKVDLKDVELTYHVFPVYRLSVPETGAESILELIVGKNVTDTYFEAFENENYTVTVEGEEVELTDIIADLKDLWNEKYEDESELATLKKAYDDADKAVEDADKPTAEQEAALETAEKAYVEARRAAIKAEIAKILSATSSDSDDLSMAEAIVEEYKEDVYHSLNESYNTEITEAVEKAVWALINKHVTVTDYPESLVKEFYDHLYNEYEYKFYKGNYSSTSTSTVTNYAKYKGVFEDYLVAATDATNADGIEAAITAEAKAALEPIIKLYVVAKAFEEEALTKLEDYIQADIDAGAYDANYKDNSALSDKENQKAKEEAEAEAEENKKEALESATYFLISDKVMKDYKKDIGNAAYRSVIETYGEINVRAALQFNRLFYYLTSTNLVSTDEGGSTHVEPSYVDVTGADPVIDFRTVKYSIKVEAEDDTTGSDD